MRSLLVIGLGALAFHVSASANQGQPTCSEFGIANHAHHIIGDYVTGIGSGGGVPGLPEGDIGWPPDGSVVGSTVSANGGAYTPGGPGPGFHFHTDLDGPGGEEHIAPGASACIEHSQSPGFHLPSPE